jgi:hypothetical protein
MKNRFSVILFSLLLFIALPAFAQQTDDDEPLPPPKHGQVKFGGAGGFTQNLLFLDLDPINQVITANKGAALNNNPVFMMGGQGYAYILFVKNLRLGGIGMSGSMSSRSIDPNQNNLRRDVQLSVGYGGITAEYVVPVVSRLDVTFGTVIGWGNLTMRMTHGQGDVAWDTLWSQFGSSQSSVPQFTHKVSGSFFLLQPSVSVEYAVLRYLGLRVGAGYSSTIGTSWTFDDQQDSQVIGVPSGVSGKGFTINAGIYLGTFIF